ncbi:hypothetical protein EDD86DRAFT_208287 [Gorgonomyces haynaldii]|nr:hypothetical protein EDD86DRAFT_208287 [Gorgonomyces haynaldii]
MPDNETIKMMMDSLSLLNDDPKSGDINKETEYLIEYDAPKKNAVLDMQSDDGQPNSLAILYQSRPNVPSTFQYTVLKLKGAPWDTSLSDLLGYLKDANVQIQHSHCGPFFTHAIHLPIVVQLARICDIYLEFPTREQALKTIHYFNKHDCVLRGRRIYCSESSQAELLGALFPSWKGVYDEGKFISDKSQPFLSRDHINFLLNTCRNQRCPVVKVEQGIENVISILSKIPWHEHEHISTAQRDHLFELTKLAIEAFEAQKQRLQRIQKCRLVRAGLCVPLFSEKQKLMMLQSAKLVCPEDLKRFVYMPESPEQKTPSPKSSTKLEITPMSIVGRERRSSSNSPTPIPMHGQGILSLQEVLQGTFDRKLLTEVLQLQQEAMELDRKRSLLMKRQFQLVASLLYGSAQ